MPQPGTDERPDWIQSDEEHEKYLRMTDPKNYGEPGDYRFMPISAKSTIIANRPDADDDLDAPDPAVPPDPAPAPVPAAVSASAPVVPLDPEPGDDDDDDVFGTALDDEEDDPYPVSMYTTPVFDQPIGMPDPVTFPTTGEQGAQRQALLAQIKKSMDKYGSGFRLLRPEERDRQARQMLTRINTDSDVPVTAKEMDAYMWQREGVLNPEEAPRGTAGSFLDAMNRNITEVTLTDERGDPVEMPDGTVLRQDQAQQDARDNSQTGYRGGVVGFLGDMWDATTDASSPLDIAPNMAEAVSRNIDLENSLNNARENPIQALANAAFGSVPEMLQSDEAQRELVEYAGGLRALRARYAQVPSLGERVSEVSGSDNMGGAIDALLPEAAKPGLDLILAAFDAATEDSEVAAESLERDFQRAGAELSDTFGFELMGAMPHEVQAERRRQTAILLGQNEDQILELIAAGEAGSLRDINPDAHARMSYQQRPTTAADLRDEYQITPEQINKLKVKLLYSVDRRLPMPDGSTLSTVFGGAPFRALRQQYGDLDQMAFGEEDSDAPGAGGLRRLQEVADRTTLPMWLAAPANLINSQILGPIQLKALEYAGVLDKSIVQKERALTQAGAPLRGEAFDAMTNKIEAQPDTTEGNEALYDIMSPLTLDEYVVSARKERSTGVRPPMLQPETTRTVDPVEVVQELYDMTGAQRAALLEQSPALRRFLQVYQEAEDDIALDEALNMDDRGMPAAVLTALGRIPFGDLPYSIRQQVFDPDAIRAAVQERRVAGRETGRLTYDAIPMFFDETMRGYQVDPNNPAQVYRVENSLGVATRIFSIPEVSVKETAFSAFYHTNNLLGTGLEKLVPHRDWENTSLRGRIGGRIISNTRVGLDVDFGDVLRAYGFSEQDKAYQYGVGAGFVLDVVINWDGTVGKAVTIGGRAVEGSQLGYNQYAPDNSRFEYQYRQMLREQGVGRIQTVGAGQGASSYRPTERQAPIEEVDNYGKPQFAVTSSRDGQRKVFDTVEEAEAFAVNDARLRNSTADKSQAFQVVLNSGETETFKTRRAAEAKAKQELSERAREQNVSVEELERTLGLDPRDRTGTVTSTDQYFVNAVDGSQQVFNTLQEAVDFSKEQLRVDPSMFSELDPLRQAQRLQVREIRPGETFFNEDGEEKISLGTQFRVVSPDGSLSEPFRNRAEAEAFSEQQDADTRVERVVTETDDDKFAVTSSRDGQRKVFDTEEEAEAFAAEDATRFEVSSMLDGESRAFGTRAEAEAFSGQQAEGYQSQLRGRAMVRGASAAVGAELFNMVLPIPNLLLRATGRGRFRYRVDFDDGESQTYTFRKGAESAAKRFKVDGETFSTREEAENAATSFRVDVGNGEVETLATREEADARSTEASIAARDPRDTAGDVTEVIRPVTEVNGIITPDEGPIARMLAPRDPAQNAGRSIQALAEEQGRRGMGVLTGLSDAQTTRAISIIAETTGMSRVDVVSMLAEQTRVDRMVAGFHLDNMERIIRGELEGQKALHRSEPYLRYKQALERAPDRTDVSNLGVSVALAMQEIVAARRVADRGEKNKGISTLADHFEELGFEAFEERGTPESVQRLRQDIARDLAEEAAGDGARVVPDLSRLNEELRYAKAEVTKEQAAANLAEWDKKRIATSKGTGLPETITTTTDIDAEQLEQAKLTEIGSGRGVEAVADDLLNLDLIAEAAQELRPLESEEGWGRWMATITGQNTNMKPPVKAQEYAGNVDSIVELIGSLTEEQAASARSGIGESRRWHELYKSGQMPPAITGLLFGWASFSRQLTAYNQEAGFLDAFNGGLVDWVNRAVEGDWLAAEYDYVGLLDPDRMVTPDDAELLKETGLRKPLVAKEPRLMDAAAILEKEGIVPPVDDAITEDKSRITAAEKKQKSEIDSEATAEIKQLRADRNALKKGKKRAEQTSISADFKVKIAAVESRAKEAKRAVGAKAKEARAQVDLRKPEYKAAVAQRRAEMFAADQERFETETAARTAAAEKLRAEYDQRRETAKSQANRIPQDVRARLMKVLEVKDAKGDKVKNNSTNTEKLQAVRELHEMLGLGDVPTQFEYLSWVHETLGDTVTPGQGAKTNINSFGSMFLERMSQTIDDGIHKGKTPLLVLHESLSAETLEMPTRLEDGSVGYETVPATGRNIRRLFWLTVPGKVGINNKVLSFMLLISGHRDVFVVDRIQARHLWDAANKGEEYGAFNIYDGMQASTEVRKNSSDTRRWSSSQGIASAFDNLRGLALYEAIEDGLRSNIQEAYRRLGRDGEGELGTFHWESWLVFGQQEVGHGSVDVMRHFAEGLAAGDPVDTPASQYIGSVEAFQGDMRTWEYGLGYSPAREKPYTFRSPDGTVWDMTVEQKQAFLKGLINQSKAKAPPADGVFTSGFQIKQRPIATKGWTEQPGIRQEGIDKLLREVDAEPRPGSSVLSTEGADGVPAAFDADQPVDGGPDGTGGVDPDLRFSRRRGKPKPRRDRKQRGMFGALEETTLPSTFERDAAGRVVDAMPLTYPEGDGEGGSYDVVSLFDGISGAMVALENANIPVGRYITSEIDRSAEAISKANYPDAERLGNVENIENPEAGAANVALPEKFDILVGGSPCQDLRKGRAGLEGDESQKFFDYKRVFDLGRHKHFLFENTGEMADADKAIITKFFGVEPILINGDRVSAANRPRWFWTNIPGVQQPTETGVKSADIMLSYDEATSLPPEQVGTLPPETVAYMERNKKGTRKPRWKARTNVIHASDEILPVMSRARGKGAPADIVNQDNKMRRLARVEGERMMGFPDGYTSVESRSAALKGLGNSFTVPVVEHILASLSNEVVDRQAAADDGLKFSKRRTSAAPAVIPPEFAEAILRMVKSGDPEQLAQAREMSLMLGAPGLHLEGAKLEDMSLRGADLSGSDLSDKAISFTYFSGADLSGADLSGARLLGSSLDGADLSGADLSGARIKFGTQERANLSGANLRGANLRDADLRGVDLRGADLSDAKLPERSSSSLDGIIYDDTTVFPVGFTPPPSAPYIPPASAEATLQMVKSGDPRQIAQARNASLAQGLPGLYLARANLRGADLSGANLRDADLSGADLSGANLSGADLSGANLKRAEIDTANLSEADLSGADLRAADMTAADITGADLRGADLRAADMTAADIAGADLRGADLRGADLRGAILTDADLTDIIYDGNTFFPDGFTPPAPSADPPAATADDGFRFSKRTEELQRAQKDDPESNVVTFSEDVQETIDRTLDAAEDMYAEPDKVIAEIEYSQGDEEGLRRLEFRSVDDIIDYDKIPLVEWASLIGARYFPTFADRTATAGLFKGLGQKIMDIAVPLLGGPLFPLRISNILYDIVWANRGLSIKGAKEGKVRDKGATHMLVMLGSKTMHESNTTVFYSMMKALLANLEDGTFSKEAAAALTEELRTMPIPDSLPSPVGEFAKDGLETRDVLNLEELPEKVKYYRSFKSHPDAPSVPELQKIQMIGKSDSAWKSQTWLDSPEYIPPPTLEEAGKAPSKKSPQRAEYDRIKASNKALTKEYKAKREEARDRHNASQNSIQAGNDRLKAAYEADVKKFHAEVFDEHTAKYQAYKDAFERNKEEKARHKSAVAEWKKRPVWDEKKRGKPAPDKYREKTKTKDGDVFGEVLTNDEYWDKLKTPFVARQKAILAAKEMRAFPETGFNDVAKVINYSHKTLTFDGRKKFITMMGRAGTEEATGVIKQALVDATIDPYLAGAPLGAGFLLIELDTTPVGTKGNKKANFVELGTTDEDAEGFGTIMHPDYPLGIRGRVVGRLPVLAGWQQLFPDFIDPNGTKKQRKNYTKLQAPGGLAKVYRALTLTAPVQEVTPALVASLSKLQSTTIQTATHAGLVASVIGNANKDAKSLNPMDYIKGVAISRQSQQRTDVLSALAGGVTGLTNRVRRKRLQAKIETGEVKIGKVGDFRVFYGMDRTEDGKYRITSLVNNEVGTGGVGEVCAVMEAIRDGATEAVAEPLTADYNLLRDMGFEPVDNQPNILRLREGINDGQYIQRYFRRGPVGLLEGRVAELGRTAARDALREDLSAPGRGQSAAERVRDAGASTPDGDDSLSSRALRIAQEIVSLNEESLAALGLTQTDLTNIETLTGTRIEEYSDDAGDSRYRIITPEDAEGEGAFPTKGEARDSLRSRDGIETGEPSKLSAEAFEGALARLQARQAVSSRIIEVARAAFYDPRADSEPRAGLKRAAAVKLVEAEVDRMRDGLPPMPKASRRSKTQVLDRRQQPGPVPRAETEYRAAYRTDRRNNKRWTYVWKTGDTADLFHEQGHLLIDLMGEAEAAKLMRVFSIDMEGTGARMGDEGDASASAVLDALVREQVEDIYLFGEDVPTAEKVEELRVAVIKEYRERGYDPSDIPEEVAADSFAMYLQEAVERHSSLANRRAEVAQQFKYWCQYRTAASGAVYAAFEMLSSAMANMYTTVRRDPKNLPIGARTVWDRWLRPDLLADSRAVDLTDQYRGEDKDLIPKVTIGGESPAAAAVVQSARREVARRGQYNRDELMRQMELQEGQTISLNELLAKSAGQVIAEQARRKMGDIEHVQITRRSVVPASRVKSIQTKVLQRLAVHGLDPERMKDAVSGQFVELDAQQKAGLYMLVGELYQQPIGRSIPARIVIEPQDRISIQEWQTVIEALLDANAGLASGRDSAVEAMIPGVGNTILRVLSSATAGALQQAIDRSSVRPTKLERPERSRTPSRDEVGRPTPLGGRIMGTTNELAKGSIGLQQAFSEAFIFQEELEGQMDPMVLEMVRETIADMEDSGRWLREAHRDAMKSRTQGSTPKTFIEVLKKMKGELTPPVPVVRVTQLRTVMDALLGKDRGSKDIRGDVLEGSHSNLQNVLTTNTLKDLQGVLELDEDYLSRSEKGVYTEVAIARLMMFADMIDKRAAELAGEKVVGDLTREQRREYLKLKMPGEYLVYPPENRREMLRTGKQTQPKTVQNLVDEAQPNFKQRAYEETIGQMSKADLVFIGQSLTHLHGELGRREHMVMQRALDIGSALTGVKRVDLSLSLSHLDAKKLYVAFYSGEWMSEGRDTLGTWQTLEGWSNTSRAEVKVGPLMFVEMLLRLKARESLARFSEKLTRYGLRVDIETLGSNIPPRVGQERTAEKGVDGVLRSYQTRELDPEAEARRQQDLPIEEQMSLKADSQYFDYVKDYINQSIQALVEVGNTVDSATSGLMAPASSDVHRYDAYQHAQGIMSRFGLRPIISSDVKNWEPYRLEDGTEVLLPEEVSKMLTQALERIVPLGETAKRTVLDKKARQILADKLNLDFSYEKAVLEGLLYGMTVSYTQAYKLGVTVGPLVPNPAYYTGNALGMIFQMHMGLGGVQTAKTIARNPKMVASVVSRLFGEQYRDDDGHVMVTSDGRIYTSDYIADLAKQQGLDTSFIGSEVVRDLLADIKRKHPRSLKILGSDKAGAFAQRIAGNPRWWQRILIDAATASDNFFRLSIFVDRLMEGDSPSAASKLARDVGYDYNRLTDFEKDTMRKVCLFYSFQRRNMSFFLNTLLKNPGRVTQQLRLLRGLQRMTIGDEEPEALIPDYLSSRYMTPALNFLPGQVMYEQHVRQSRIHKYVTVYPPASPAVESLALMLDIWGASPPGGATESSWQEIIPQLHPFIQMPIVGAFNINPMSGRELSDTMPAWAVKCDRALTGGQITRSMFGVTVEYDKFGAKVFRPSITTSSGANGQRAWYMLNAGGAFIPGVGRSGSTFESLDRIGILDYAVMGCVAVGKTYMDEDYMEDFMDGGAYGDMATPRPGYSVGDEAAKLFGLGKTAVPSRLAVRERLFKVGQARMGDATKELDQGESLEDLLLNMPRYDIDDE